MGLVGQEQVRFVERKRVVMAGTVVPDWFGATGYVVKSRGGVEQSVPECRSDAAGRGGARAVLS